MKPESRREIAIRLVVEAEAVVARQRQLVAHLHCKGYSTEEAIKLLENFEKALKNYRRTLNMLKSAVSEVTHYPA